MLFNVCKGTTKHRKYEEFVRKHRALDEKKSILSPLYHFFA